MNTPIRVARPEDIPRLAALDAAADKHPWTERQLASACKGAGGQRLWLLEEASHPVAFAALCSSNFTVAVGRVRDHTRLCVPKTLTLTEHDDQLTLTWRWNLPVAPMPFGDAVAPIITSLPVKSGCGPTCSRSSALIVAIVPEAP